MERRDCSASGEKSAHDPRDSELPIRKGIRDLQFGAQDRIPCRRQACDDGVALAHPRQDRHRTGEQQRCCDDSSHLAVPTIKGNAGGSTLDARGVSNMRS